MKNFIDLFKTNIGYVEEQRTEVVLSDLIRRSENEIDDIWQKQRGYQTLKTGLKWALTEVCQTLYTQSTETKTKQEAFQNLFEYAFKSIIENHQQQTKQHFMCDLYSTALNDINKSLLIKRIQEIDFYQRIGSLEALLHKIKHESDAKIKKEDSNPPFVRKPNSNDEKIKKVYGIYHEVAKELNVPVLLLVENLINKKKRNDEVHRAEDCIKDYLNQHPPQKDRHVEFSDFLKHHQISAELPTFTSEEIQQTQQIFCNFAKYANLDKKEK
jgi:hypothetical protein